MKARKSYLKFPKDPLEKEMATRSRILAWKTPWTEEPGWLHSTGCKRIKKNLVTKQQQQSQRDTEWENQTSGL